MMWVKLKYYVGGFFIFLAAFMSQYYRAEYHKRKSIKLRQRALASEKKRDSLLEGLAAQEKVKNDKELKSALSKRVFLAKLRDRNKGK